MSDDATAKDLGLRALEAGFRWAPGVKLGNADETYRLTFAWYSEDEDDGATPIMHPAGDGIGPGWGWPADGSGWWPDFRDPATLGVLLGQFVAAWQPTATRNGATDEQWRAYKRALSLVARWAGGDSTAGDELAEALVAALPSNWQCPACGTLHIKAPASFKCPCGTHRG